MESNDYKRSVIVRRVGEHIAKTSREATRGWHANRQVLQPLAGRGCCARESTLGHRMRQLLRIVLVRRLAETGKSQTVFTLVRSESKVRMFWKINIK